MHSRHAFASRSKSHWITQKYNKTSWFARPQIAGHNHLTQNNLAGKPFSERKYTYPAGRNKFFITAASSKRYNLRDVSDRTSYVIWFSSRWDLYVSLITWFLRWACTWQDVRHPHIYLLFTLWRSCSRTQTHSFQDNDHHRMGPTRAQIHVHSSTCHQKGAACAQICEGLKHFRWI